jgi:hypothetical protein
MINEIRTFFSNFIPSAGSIHQKYTYLTGSLAGRAAKVTLFAGSAFLLVSTIAYYIYQRNKKPDGPGGTGESSPKNDTSSKTEAKNEKKDIVLQSNENGPKEELKIDTKKVENDTNTQITELKNKIQELQQKLDELEKKISETTDVSESEKEEVSTTSDEEFYEAEDIDKETEELLNIDNQIGEFEKQLEKLGPKQPEDLKKIDIVEIPSNSLIKEGHPSTSTKIEIVEEKKETDLAKLFDALPGCDLTCTYKRDGTIKNSTIRDYLFAHLFRQADIQSCTLTEDKQFALTYSESKNVVFKELPEIAYQKMPLGVPFTVRGIIKCKPEVQLAKEVKGKITINSSTTLQTQDWWSGEIKETVLKGTKIEFDENALLPVKNVPCEGHLKSILFVSNSEENKGKDGKAYHLFVEFKLHHWMNGLSILSRLVPEGSPIDHQLLIETLDMNLFPEHYPKKEEL